MACKSKMGVQLENNAGAKNLRGFVENQRNSRVPRAALLQPTSGTQAPSTFPKYWEPSPSTGQCVAIPDTSQAAESWHVCSSCSKWVGAAAEWGGSQRLSPGEAVVALTEGPCAGSLPHQRWFQQQPKAAEHQPPQRSAWGSLVLRVYLSPLTQYQQGPQRWKSTPDWGRRDWKPLRGPKTAPPPLQGSHQSTTGSSSRTCTGCEHSLGHTVSLSPCSGHGHHCSNPGNRAGSWCITSLSSRRAGGCLYLEH